MKKTTVLLTFILIFNFLINVPLAQAQSAPVSFASLGRGSKGPSVLALQRLLISQGYLGVNFATGNYGPLTVQAVQKFQKAKGLSQVGRVGPATLTALNNIQNPPTLPVQAPANPNTNTNNNAGSNSGASTPNTPNNPPINPPTPPTPPVPPVVPPTPPAPPVPPQTPPPIIPTNPNPSARPCVQGATTYIQVMSPNGGEIFTAGSQIGVRWFTCNYPSRAVSIYLEYFAGNAIAPIVTPLAIGTPNDFGEQVTLPTINSQAQSGTFYKIAITDGPEPALANVLDESDALFTIN